ncbi:MAG: hypothetical protein AUJ12_08490 [Alphaproteobacteria bacterium CG1_02_46_17]|nr:MAG: hypothetical protein AUJ12_08490 [Alphaproteobacteria bacterium CG1_02_46_17]
MAKSKSNDLKPLGNENSYTPEFFDELYKKVDLKNPNKKADLRLYVILAAQKYMSLYGEYLRQLAAHEVEKELRKVANYLGKAQESLWKVIMSGNYAEDIVNNLYDVISKNHPPLHGLLKEIKRDGPFISGISPARSLPLLSSMEEAIGRIVKNFLPKKSTPRSVALYHWIMVLSAELEPIIGRKLEQSRYHKTDKGGEYISKKEMNDSELLLFIITPLDSNVTISQIETALKDTRKERHEAPWDNYFPK